MSYTELARQLRNCASDTGEDCDGCPYQGGYKGTYCMNGLISEAADVIEELANWWSMAKTLSDMVMPKWVPVTERLPEYGTPVLAYGSRGGIFVAKYERARAEWDIDHWWKLNSSIHVCNPTHWMPLPEPPKEET